MTTKAEFKKTLQGQINTALQALGYGYDKSRASFAKPVGPCEIRIAYTVSTAGYPKNIVAVDVRVFIDIPRVNEIGASLFSPPDVNPATLWGTLRIFTPANSTRDTNYYFDIHKDDDTSLGTLIKDLKIFDNFAGTLTDLHALSNERLAKVPMIRKNFGQGLSWDYKYGIPQYIAIVHALNKEFEDARACAEHANHLNAEEKQALLGFIADQAG